MYRAVREFEEPSLPPQVLLDVVYDVAGYPTFVKGVKRVEVLSREADHLLAEFTAGVAGMSFTYVLRVEQEPGSVRWRRVAGSFKDAEGCMLHLGWGRFRYENAMDPGFAVPDFAVRFILEGSLPRLIREFRERARQVTSS